MDIDNLNKSTCEEIFGGELDVTKEFEVEKPQAWQYRDCLVEMAAKKDKMIRRRLRKRSWKRRGREPPRNGEIGGGSD